MTTPTNAEVARTLLDAIRANDPLDTAQAIAVARCYTELARSEALQAHTAALLRTVHRQGGIVTTEQAADAVRDHDETVGPRIVKDSPQK